MKQTTQRHTRNAVAVAAALAAFQMGLANAQTAAKADNSTLNLDEVVITASPVARSKMKSTDSVSTVGEEAIFKTGATNAAEILRTIPGVRSESSGGEGNANITVRGAPISAGGGRYIQFQEDGLPVLFFGDIAFGTADQFLRTDFMTDRVEVVRGGGASTQVSNAPGGVVNFLSKTGRDAGSSVGLTLGVGSKLTRFDGSTVINLSKDTYVNVGGYFRQGNGGAQSTDFTSQKGGQLRASLTKELDKGSYLRVNFKSLDDITPSLMPVPTYLTGTGVKTVNTIKGVDPLNAFFINSRFSRDVTVDRNGNTVVSNPQDGLHVKSTGIGFEGKINLDSGWTIEDKFRTTKNSGRFIALFPADNGGATPTVTPGTFGSTLFNTSLDNMDNTFNDLKLSRQVNFGGGKGLVSAGLLTGSQNIAQTWFWNQYTVNMNGSGVNPTPTSTGWATWGGCCARTYDVKYKTNAPYAALQYDNGPWATDASIRQNNIRASGYTLSGNGVNAWNAASRETVNYKNDKMSYSLGANYSVNKDTSVYARLSDGVNFAGDRLLYGAAGSLNNKPTSFNQLKQQELGVKYRSGGLSLFGTYFMAQTNESNYEATTQKFTVNSYKANGIELEAGYRVGAFRINSGATYTNASITDSLTKAQIGKTPRRQAKMVYTVAPSYRMGDVELGAAFIGSGSSWADDDNTIQMPSYTITNLFASYRVNKQAALSLSVNNAFNKLAFTEVEGDGHAARALPGRSAKVALRYDF